MKLAFELQLARSPWILSGPMILRATLFAAPLFAPGSFLPQLGLIALVTLIAAFIPSY
jgi:hypothetical protein